MPHERVFVAQTSLPKKCALLPIFDYFGKNKEINTPFYQ